MTKSELFVQHFYPVGCSARGNEGWERRGHAFVAEASDFDVASALGTDQKLVAAVEWHRRYGSTSRLGTKGWAVGCDERAAELLAADPAGAERVRAAIADWQAEEARLRMAYDDTRRAAAEARAAVPRDRAEEARRWGGRWPEEVEAAEAAERVANEAWVTHRSGVVALAAGA